MAEVANQPEVDKANPGNVQGSLPHLQLVPPLAPRLIRFRRRARLPRHGPQSVQRRGAPCLTEIPIGTQGIAFDRLELDAWVDNISPATDVPLNGKETIDMGRTRTPGLIKRGGIWHIDKQIRGRRICESTGER